MPGADPVHRERHSRRVQPWAPGPGGADPLKTMLWVAVALLMAAIVGVALYKAWPMLFPRIAERAPLDPSCDITRIPCAVHFADRGSVRLDIRPRGIPTVQPLDIEARLAGLPAPERVELDFAGLDMDMGYNRVELSPAPEDLGVYTGRGMLPVCVRDRMTWEARVLLHQSDGALAAPFRFETTRPGAGRAPED